MVKECRAGSFILIIITKQVNGKTFANPFLFKEELNFLGIILSSEWFLAVLLKERNEIQVEKALSDLV